MKLINPHHSCFNNAPASIRESQNSIQVIPYEENLVVMKDNTIYIAELAEPKDLVAMVNDKKIQHVIQRNEKYFWNEVASTAKIIENPHLYFESSGEIILGEVVKSHKVIFAGAQDKVRLKSEVENFTHEISGRGLSDCIEIVLEELYMNAILDAPAQAQKLGYIASMEARKCEMSVSRSEEILVLSCMDSFGSLRIDKFVQRMHEVYEKGAGAAINYGEGGAGLGCILMFENCLSLYLGVEPRRRTVVSCSIPIGLGNKARAAIKKSFHRIETKVD